MKKQEVINNIVLAKLESLRYRTAPVEMQNLQQGETVEISTAEYRDLKLPAMYGNQNITNGIYVDEEKNSIIVPQQNVGFVTITVTFDILTSDPNYFFYVRAAHIVEGEAIGRSLYSGETKSERLTTTRNTFTFHTVISQYNNDAPEEYKLQVIGMSADEKTASARITSISVKQIPRYNE